ncbi:HNH endonuclease signature motif containing protein [Rathayibacter sp. VKM Ac-2801]|uniref:HNH endonuclease signature motif containing protein n=1 Tax=Rathayibacter sp. VKM Ac-2801 TaxID=2609255 RepID=UPI0013201992|nr:HNH endonuclease signature motif containing protein [Rathayibacter sp. VKM Ac-2801]QHC69201.1 DUF222 domain-containing protein [Rathayibacter sp. VKM Ac-2801]
MQTLDAVRALAGLAAGLARSSAPVLLASAVALHTAYRAALLVPESFARGSGLSRSEAGDLVERSIRAEFAMALGMSERAASRRLEHARLLIEDLPATRALLSEARILWEAGEVVCAAAASLPASTRAAFDERAAAAALSQTPTQLRRTVARLRDELHEEPFTERHARAREDRSVWLGAEADGMATLCALLPAPVALGAYNRLDRIARSLRDGADAAGIGLGFGATAKASGNASAGAGAGACAHGGAGAGGDVRVAVGAGADAGAGAGAGLGAETGGGAVGNAGISLGDGRTLAQLRADALVDLLIDGDIAGDGSTGEGASGVPASVCGVRADVRLTLAASTAVGLDDAPADLDGYGLVPADVARELVRTAASFTRVLTDPDTGAVASVGRTVRVPPPRMRLQLQLRDRTCRFPGCTRPASTAEADHTLEWRNGGETALGNLASLCVAHHHVRHGDRWTYVLRPDGTVVWTTPTGRRITDRPQALPGAPLMPTQRPTAHSSRESSPEPPPQPPRSSSSRSWSSRPGSSRSSSPRPSPSLLSPTRPRFVDAPPPF